VIHLGFLLHFHQPPDQFPEALDRLAAECYGPVLEVLHAHPEARFTINLTWSLAERWIERGHYQCLDSMRSLLERGRAEATGCAAYHPVLPLIGAEEMRRQITLNSERLREVFGLAYAPRGFFPPELAYGHELPPVLQELGFAWCLAEDIPYVCLHEKPPYNFVPVCADLPVLLRSSMWSNAVSLDRHPEGRRYTASEIITAFTHCCQEWFGDEDGYLILALDAETFGGHIKGHVQQFLGPFLDYLQRIPHRVRLVGISDLCERFPRHPSEVPPGSWSTSVEDFWQGDFFPLWKSRHNRAHQLLWELTELAVGSVGRLQSKLDRGLDSSNYHDSPTRRGMETMLEVIAAAAPEELPRAQELSERLVRFLESNGTSP